MAQAVQRAILRSFASSGRPPGPGELDAVTAGTCRTTAEVLAVLHELDAIRLASDGRIVVAYPFSATPTRHRVRIGNHTEVYAMCAIDALGMPAMLDMDVRVDSMDATTGRPVTVSITGGHSRWDPAEAVVFVGADPRGGPSADCCCDYLNFFTDREAADVRARAGAGPDPDPGRGRRPRNPAVRVAAPHQVISDSRTPRCRAR